MKLGIYRLHEMSESELKSIEILYQTPIHLISVYRAWNNCNISDDIEWLNNLKNIPRDIMITWEPWKIIPDNQIKQSKFSLLEIVSGKYEKYIRDFANALRGFKTNIFLRPMHEMNGNWYPWCGTVNNNKPEDYLKAWYYLKNIVNKETPDIKWVFSVHAKSFPDEDYNDISQYFPGDDALDFMGIDGYNWGDYKEWSKWMTFEEIFREAYSKIIKISNRPIMITETACAESGGQKDQWIIDTAESLKLSFKRVKIVVWFDIKKEQDWRIDSSKESLKAINLLYSARS